MIKISDLFISKDDFIVGVNCFLNVNIFRKIYSYWNIVTDFMYNPIGIIWCLEINIELNTK